MSWESNKVYGFLVVALIIGFGVGFLAGRYTAGPEALEAITFEGWGGPTGAVNVEFAEAFKTQTGHPVLVQYHAGASSTVVPKIQAAWPEVTIDATNVAPGVAFELAAAGYLAELTPDKVPVMNEIPESLQIKYEDKVIGLGLYAITVTPVVWRSDIITEPIDEWADLLKPEYKGKIAISYMALGTGSALVDTALIWGGDEKNVEPGWTKLKELAPQIGAVWTTEAENLSFLSSGDYPICLFVTSNKVFTLASQGVEVDWRAGFDDTPTKRFESAVDCMVVVDGPRKEITFQWMDFYFQAENNEKYCGEAGLTPSNKNANLNPDIEPWVPSPADIDMYGAPVDFKTRAEKIDEWTTRWDTEIAPLIGS